MPQRRRKGRSPAEPLEHDDPHSLAAHVGRHLAWLEGPRLLRATVCGPGGPT